MAFWPMGRSSDGPAPIFIRRNTRGNPVYTYTLREYIGYLIEKRFSLQFYAEGGRSRTGKLLPPRLGPARLHRRGVPPGSSEDVVLVPVSIAYDQLQEVGEFAREAKGRKQIRREHRAGWSVRFPRTARAGSGRSTSASVSRCRSVRRSDRRRANPSDTDEDTESEGDRLALQKVGLEVSRRINEVTPITATSLVTLSAFSVRRVGVDHRPGEGHGPRSARLQASTRGLPLTRNMALDTERGCPAGAARARAPPRGDEVRGGPGSSLRHRVRPAPRRGLLPEHDHPFLPARRGSGCARSGECRQGRDPIATFWEAVLAGGVTCSSSSSSSSHTKSSAPRSRRSSRIKIRIGRSGSRRGPTVSEVLSKSRPHHRAHGLAVVLRGLRGGRRRRSFATRTTSSASPSSSPGVWHSAGSTNSSNESTARSHSKPLFANALKLAASRDLIGPSADHEAQRRFLDEVRRPRSAISTSSSSSPPIASCA